MDRRHRWSRTICIGWCRARLPEMSRSRLRRAPICTLTVTVHVVDAAAPGPLGQANITQTTRDTTICHTDVFGAFVHGVDTNNNLIPPSYFEKFLVAPDAQIVVRTIKVETDNGFSSVTLTIVSTPLAAVRSIQRRGTVCTFGENADEENDLQSQFCWPSRRRLKRPMTMHICIKS